MSSWHAAENVVRQQQTEDKFKPPATGAAGGIFSTLESLAGQVIKDPDQAAQFIRLATSGIALIASAVSFIPFTNNLGGALAALTIDHIVKPFRDKAVDAPLEDFLDNYFPVREANPRILVSALEHGAISDDDLVRELVDAGTKTRGIQVVLKLARVLRFDEVTREPLRLVRKYNDMAIDAVIKTLQDDERAVITDLTIRRRELLSEVRRRSRKTGPTT